MRTKGLPRSTYRRFSPPPGSISFPSAAGKKYSSDNKVVNYIIGGWAFNGILTLTSGQPFDVGVGGDQALTLNFGCCNGYYERLNG